MEHGNVHRSGELNAAAALRLLERCDALRRPQRFDELLLACECDARGGSARSVEPHPQRERSGTALRAALAVGHARSPRRRRRAALGSGGGDAVREARVRPSPPHSERLDQRPDRHRDQAQQQAAGDRQVPLGGRGKRKLKSPGSRPRPMRRSQSASP